MEEPRLLSLRAVDASWHFGIKFIWCRKPAEAQPHLRSLIPFVAWVEHYVDTMGQDRTAPDIFEFCLLLLYLASHVRKGESKPKSMPRPDTRHPILTPTTTKYLLYEHEFEHIYPESGAGKVLGRMKLLELLRPKFDSIMRCKGAVYFWVAFLARRLTGLEPESLHPVCPRWVRVN